MKSTAMMTMAAMLGSMAWAGGKSDDQKVVACMEASGNDLEMAVAQVTAAALFRQAGVKLEWHTGRRACEAQRDQAILVSLSTNTPQELYPGALAYALPFEGVHIRVLYDRVAHAGNDLRRFLLAYVLVHEITHILEGADWHSASGIMEAHWDSREIKLMAGSRLRFTPLDIEMIRESLAARAARRASNTLVASAASLQ